MSIIQCSGVTPVIRSHISMWLAHFTVCMWPFINALSGTLGENNVIFKADKYIDKQL